MVIDLSQSISILDENSLLCTNLTIQYIFIEQILSGIHYVKHHKKKKSDNDIDPAMQELKF